MRNRTSGSFKALAKDFELSRFSVSPKGEPATRKLLLTHTRPDDRPTAQEVVHRILGLYTQLFDSPSEKLWQRHVSYLYSSPVLTYDFSTSQQSTMLIVSITWQCLIPLERSTKKQ